MPEINCTIIEVERAYPIPPGTENEWTWCYVQIVFTCGPSNSLVSIGPCSYESEEAFMRSAEYKDAQRDARKFLIEDLKEAADAYQFLLTLKD